MELAPYECLRRCLCQYSGTHRAVGQALGIETMQRIADDRQEGHPVPVIVKDRLAPVSPRCDVINGSGELDAERAGHGLNLGCDMAKGKT